MRKSIALGIAAAFVSGGIALAANQGAAAKKLLVKAPPSGNKKIVYLSKNTTATVVGDPVANGATFTIALTPGGTQCMSLPASGWSPISTLGFKYKDPTLANGPVKVALIKKTPSGNFLLKVIAKNSAGNPITVAPGNPTATYGTNLEIGSGDDYCASTGSAAPTKNDVKTFQVKNDDGALCTTSCSSPSGAFLDASAAF
jgi:hypothetical protein